MLTRICTINNSEGDRIDWITEEDAWRIIQELVVFLNDNSDNSLGIGRIMIVKNCPQETEEQDKL